MQRRVASKREILTCDACVEKTNELQSVCLFCKFNLCQQIRNEKEMEAFAIALSVLYDAA
jgi:hypothetical protein